MCGEKKNRKTNRQTDKQRKRQRKQKEKDKLDLVISPIFIYPQYCTIYICAEKRKQEEKEKEKEKERKRKRKKKMGMEKEKKKKKESNGIAILCATSLFQSLLPTWYPMNNKEAFFFLQECGSKNTI